MLGVLRAELTGLALEISGRAQDWLFDRARQARARRIQAEIGDLPGVGLSYVLFLPRTLGAPILHFTLLVEDASDQEFVAAIRRLNKVRSQYRHGRHAVSINVGTNLRLERDNDRPAAVWDADYFVGIAHGLRCVADRHPGSRFDWKYEHRDGDRLTIHTADPVERIFASVRACFGTPPDWLDLQITESGDVTTELWVFGFPLTAELEAAARQALSESTGSYRLLVVYGGRIYVVDGDTPRPLLAP